MKKNTIKVAVGLGLAQLALHAVSARAQDSTRVLNDVVINATKTNQKQSQTGKVVTVITRQQLDRSAGKTLPELLNEQAGVLVNGAGSNMGKDKSLYLRGADAKYTLILLDGILVNDPSILGDVFDLRLLAVDQIDHIEILKGGQSTLYGSDAVAGVVNIVTKKDARPGIHANLLASGGSYGTAKGAVAVNGRINKVLSFDVNYTHLRTDGVSEAAKPDNYTGYFDKDGFIQDAVNTRLGIKATDKLTINPFFRYFYNNARLDEGAYTDDNTTARSRSLNTGTNAVYLLGKGALNFNYNYTGSNRFYRTPYGNNLYLGRLHYADLYFNQQLGNHVQLLAGADNRYSRFNARGGARADSSVNLFGAYGSLFVSRIASILNIEAGGRYYHHSLFGGHGTYSFTPSVDVLQNGQLRVFGTISSSFKAPDLSSLYGPFGANPDLKPEKSNSYEAGASTQLFNKMFDIRVVLFKRHVNDAIIYGAKGYENQAVQNARGIEVEPSLNLGAFGLKGYYTYLKGYTIRGTEAAGFATKNYLLRRPNHTVGLFAGWKATEGFYLSASYRNYGNRYDEVFNNATYATDLVQLKHYNLVDAYAEYAFKQKRLKLFVDVKNILNAKYAELAGYTVLGTNFNAGISYAIQ